jgi:nucleotide-binding universal stress UspA family protein
MTTVQAREKIEKLLRLADDKAATPAEAKLARERATSLASKNNISIHGNAPSAPLFTIVENPNPDSKVFFYSNSDVLTREVLNEVFRRFRDL